MSERATNICSVSGCGNRLKPIFRFPNPKKHEARCRRWITAIKNPRFQELSPDQVYKRGFMCSKHFGEQDYIVGTKRLLPTAVPSHNLPSGVVVSEQSLTRTSEDPSTLSNAREPEGQVEINEPLTSSSVSGQEVQNEVLIAGLSGIQIIQRLEDAQVSKNSENVNVPFEFHDFGVCVTDLCEDQSDLQMVEEAEILYNLNLFDARFIDVPDTAGSQPINIPIFSTEKQDCDKITFDNNHNIESENEKIKKLQIDQCNKGGEVVFDLELDVQENVEISNGTLTISEGDTISGGEKSPKTPSTFTKPYFRSVKSYLKDCNRMTEVCRICFCSLEDKEVIKLYEDTPEQDSTQIKNMLQFVLPDLDLEIYPNTVICTKCVELLLYSYQLKEKWLKTEEKLQKIIEKKEGVLNSVADLVIIGKLLKDKNVQNVKNVSDNDHTYFGEPDFQEGTRKNMTTSILEKILQQPNEKSAPVSVFYGELNLNDKNRNRIQRRAYQVAEQKKRKKLERTKLGPFMCERCGHMVKSYHSLRRHLIRHTIPKVKKTKERKFMCELCGQLFSNPSNLKQHASKHAEYKCSFCNRVFNHQFRLREHIKCKHIGKGYQCHVCGKQLSYACSLKAHMMLHYPKPKRQACPICDKKFRYPCNLKKHLHSHVREKSLRCEYCGTFLKHEISLRKHIKIYHLNQGKNVCELCNKPYWKKCDLERHKIRCHGGDFDVKGSNERNEEIISKEEVCTKKSLRCEYCGRFLKHKTSLRKHIQIYHLNQGKNVCELCNKPYWKKCDLEKHKIRCHGGDVTAEESIEQNAEEVIYEEEVCTDDVYYAIEYEDSYTYEL